MISAYDTEGTATALALLGLSIPVTCVIVSPFADVLVDRWDRRRVMFFADLIPTDQSLLPFHQHDGDIIPASLPVGGIHQRLAGIEQVGILNKNGLNFWIAYVIGEPVAA